MYETRTITIDLKNIKRKIREYYEQLYADKFINLDEPDTFLWQISKACLRNR